MFNIFFWNVSFEYSMFFQLIMQFCTRPEITRCIKDPAMEAIICLNQFHWGAHDTSIDAPLGVLLVWIVHYVYCNLMVRRAHDVLCKDPSPVWAIIIFCHNIRTTNLGNALVHCTWYTFFSQDSPLLPNPHIINLQWCLW